MFDLGLDSLGIVELASSLQQEFKAAIEIAQINVCKTIADIVQLVRQNIEHHMTLSHNVPDIEIPGKRGCGQSSNSAPP